MTTFGGVVEEILSILQGYTLSPDQVTYLSSDLPADGLSISVAAYNSGSSVNPGLGAGLVEIGDELIWIDNYDDGTSVLTALPRGRGWRGTTATAHAKNETVVISPLVPRHRVKSAINDVLASLWPSLYGVAQDEFTYASGTQAAWPVPADAEKVLDVRYRDRNGNWERVRKWEVEHSPSGAEVRLCGVEHGATVRVVYGKRPSPLTAETDDFTTTGLPVSAKDVVVYGALVKVVPALDAGRLGVQYVPADELDQPRQLGAAMSIAREFKQEFATALQREQAALQNLYPARIHQTR